MSCFISTFQCGLKILLRLLLVQVTMGIRLAENFGGIVSPKEQNMKVFFFFFFFFQFAFYQSQEL